MRVVLDTNVVVSGLMTAHGACGQILDLLIEGVFEICADDQILDGYHSVLHRPALRIDQEDAGDVLELVRSVVQPVPAVPLAVELPDPHDLPFLEVAATAEAVLVTGNARHYPRSARAGVTVLRPADFLELVRRSP